MSVLVVDVGTSGVRAAVMRPDASIGRVHQVAVPPSRPSPACVEFDAAALAEAALAVARRRSQEREASAPSGSRRSAPRRSSGSASTGRPVAPGISWQDLRTAGQCLALRQRGFRLSPEPVGDEARLPARLSTIRRASAICASGRSSARSPGRSRRNPPTSPTPRTPASPVSSSTTPRTGTRRCSRSCASRRAMLPRIVDSTGVVAAASALPGEPPIAGLVGDQQASLVGQGCLAARRGEGDVRHRRDARLLSRQARPRSAAAASAAPSRSSPGASRGTSLGHRGDHALGGILHRVAARRARPASATRPSPTTSRPRCPTPAASSSSRRSAVSARRCGTSGRAAPSSGSTPRRHAPKSSGPSSRASPTAAPTCSRRRKPTAGSTIERLRVDGGMSANTTFLQLLADALSAADRSVGRPRRRRSAPPSSPARPSGLWAVARRGGVDGAARAPSSSRLAAARPRALARRPRARALRTVPDDVGDLVLT